MTQWTFTPIILHLSQGDATGDTRGDRLMEKRKRWVEADLLQQEIAGCNTIQGLPLVTLILGEIKLHAQINLI